MKGLLIYHQSDYVKSKKYIEWLITEGKKFDLKIDLMFSDEFFKHGYDGHKALNFVINRSRNTEISYLFELNNVRVFNPSKISYIGNNKLAAFQYAKSLGYPFAKVLTHWSDSNSFISKPVSGHGGEGIFLSSDGVAFNEERFQQAFITDLVGDIRFYVINNKIIDAVIRYPKGGYLANFSQGGDFERYAITDRQRGYIERFIEDLQSDYIGLDFFLLENNKLIFNELEDVVGSRMLSHLGDNQTTTLFMKHIVNVLNKI